MAETIMSTDLAVKALRLEGVELRKEIIQLRDDLSQLALACDNEGMKTMANNVRYILGQSEERGVLG